MANSTLPSILPKAFSAKTTLEVDATFATVATISKTTDLKGINIC